MSSSTAQTSSTSMSLDYDQAVEMVIAFIQLLEERHQLPPQAQHLSFKDLETFLLDLNSPIEPIARRARLCSRALQIWTSKLMKYLEYNIDNLERRSQDKVFGMVLKYLRQIHKEFRDLLNTVEDVMDPFRNLDLLLDDDEMDALRDDAQDLVNCGGVADPTGLTSSELVSAAVQIRDLLERLPEMQVNMDVDWSDFKNQDWIALARQNQVAIEGMLQEQEYM